MWQTLRERPNTRVHVAVYGSWQSDTATSVMYQGVLPCLAKRCEQRFSLLPPTKPGEYRMRWVVSEAGPLCNGFYGKKDDDEPNPNIFAWSEILFAVDSRTADVPTGLLPVNIEIVERAGLLWAVDHDSAATFAHQQCFPMCIVFSKDADEMCRKYERTLAKAQHVLEPFVLIWVDGETNSPLLEKYDVASWPTILLLNSSGTELESISGYASRTVFARMCRKAYKECHSP